MMLQIYFCPLLQNQSIQKDAGVYSKHFKNYFVFLCNSSWLLFEFINGYLIKNIPANKYQSLQYNYAENNKILNCHLINNLKAMMITNANCKPIMKIVYEKI